MLDYLDAYHLGCDIAKRAGFELAFAARNSETCYYTHPARKGLLLRISTHKSKHAPIGNQPPVARITFSPKDRYLSEQRIYDMMRWAIGSYFVNKPKPSQYDGPKQWRVLTDGVAAQDVVSRDSAP